MLRVAAVGLLLLASCSAPSSAAATSSPAPAASCLLPIYWFEGDVPNTVHTGFFSYPGGRVQGETNTVVRSPNDTFVAPAATYDRVVGRWLPVTPNAISPDGLSYAYADYDLVTLTGTKGTVAMAGALATTGRVHVVDAHTGADRIVFSGSPTYRVVGYTSDGVYLADALLTMDGLFASGLFLMPHASGAPQPVAGGNGPMDRAGWEVEGAYAWGSAFATGGSITGGNRVLSLDLKTGGIRTWLTWPEGVAANVIGLDVRGLPIVGVYQADSTSSGPSPALEEMQVWTLSAPGAGKIVYRSTDPNATLPTGPAFADSHGVWFGGSPPSSVWLWTGAAMNRVAVPVTGLGWVGVGGQCV
jgi:hypothetical protein